MSGIHRYSRALALALLFVTLPFTEASAHCFVGARFFPATLATDDPCVADEMSLPTVSWSRTADMPPANQWDLSGELSKRITEDFGVSIGTTWTQIRGPGGPTMAGFDNIETAAQYQLLKDSSHELALLVGLVMDWGSTGAINSGIATPYSVLTPTFDFVDGSFIPQVLAWGGSIQYSMPYLKSEILDLQLPDFINHLIPIVEFQMSTPVANNFGNSFVTTGTINPGVIWVGSYFQVGLEAQVPVNAQSGHGIGVIGQLHLYLDDMFPKTIGQPLIGPSTPTQQLKF